MLTTNSTLPVLRYLFRAMCQCAEVVSITNSTPIMLCYLLPFFDLHLMNVVVLRTNSTRVVVLISV